MGETPDDDCPPMVRGMQWASRVTTISLEMVLPGLGGLWLDRKLGTVMVFLVLGVALGMTVGMMHLVRIAASQNEKSKSSAAESESSDPPPRQP